MMLSGEDSSSSSRRLFGLKDSASSKPVWAESVLAPSPFRLKLLQGGLQLPRPKEPVVLPLVDGKERRKRLADEEVQKALASITADADVALTGLKSVAPEPVDEPPALRVPERPKAPVPSKHISKQVSFLLKRIRLRRGEHKLPSAATLPHYPPSERSVCSTLFEPPEVPTIQKEDGVHLAQHRREYQQQISSKNRARAVRVRLERERQAAEVRLNRSLTRRAESDAVEREAKAAAEQAANQEKQRNAIRNKKKQNREAAMLAAKLSCSFQEGPNSAVLLDSDCPDGADDEQSFFGRRRQSDDPDANGGRLNLPKLKRARSTRMQQVSLLRKENQQQSRLQRLLNARRDEFFKLPLSEQAALRSAFNQQDSTESGMLEMHQLRDALADMGIRGHNEVEKREITILIQEVAVLGGVDFYNFCFDLVPRARRRLGELNHVPMFEMFCQYDSDGSGILSSDECKDILTSICKGFMDRKAQESVAVAFEEIFATIVATGRRTIVEEPAPQPTAPAGEGKHFALAKEFVVAKQATVVAPEPPADDGPEDGLNFEQYQDFMGRMVARHERIRRERVREIVQDQRLDEKSAITYRDQLMQMYETFSDLDADRSTGLDDKECRTLLNEFGLLPKTEKELQMAEALISEHDSDGVCGIDFREFLGLVTELRTAVRKSQSEILRVLFKRCDTDRSGELSLAEVSAVLAEFDLTPRSREDQDEIKALLEESDDDGSGTLSFEEFEVLVQKIQEKFRCMQRLRELETAKELGYSNARVAELREAFWSLDANGNGQLTFDDVKRMAQLLQFRLDEAGQKNLFLSIDKDNSGFIDFEEFLIFMKRVEEKEQIGAEKE